MGLGEWDDVPIRLLIWSENCNEYTSPQESGSLLVALLINYKFQQLCHQFACIAHTLI